MLAKVHREQCGKPGCGFCGKIPEKPMKCGKCLQVTYCDKECQTRDWKFIHKKECKAKESAWCTRGRRVFVYERRENISD